MKKYLPDLSKWIIFGVAILLLLIFVPSIFNYRNIPVLLKRSAFIAIPGIGLCILMISGSFDLSFVGVIGVASVLIVEFLNHELSMAAVLLLTLVICLVFEVINFIFVDKFNLHPWLVTIGTMLVFLGIEKSVSKGDFMRLRGGAFDVLRSQTFFGLSPVVIILCFYVFVSFLLINKLKIGRMLYAIGGNKTASEKVGINITPYKLFSWLYLGFSSWLTAVLYMLETNGYEVESAAHNQLEIILVVFFGIALSKLGEKNVLGTFIGSFFVILFTNGLGILGVNVYWIKVYVGIMLLGIIMMNSFGRRSSASES